MDQHFLKSYVDLLIQTCHRRGAHAMGGMAAQIPIRDDPAANEAAMARVRADKLREAHAGHDGTWIAHPGLAPIAIEAFDSVMRGPNQLGVTRADVNVTAADLLQLPPGADHRGRPARLHPRRRAVHRGLAARQRLRAAVQPDGGRGDRGDLPRPAVAVAAPRCAHRATGSTITVERFDRLLTDELDRIHARSRAARLAARRVPDRRAPVRAHDQERDFR